MYSSSYSNAQQMPQQNGIHFGQDSTSSSSDGNTKQELIKMLLEMSPGDVRVLIKIFKSNISV